MLWRKKKPRKKSAQELFDEIEGREERPSAQAMWSNIKSRGNRPGLFARGRSMYTSYQAGAKQRQTERISRLKSQASELEAQTKIARLQQKLNSVRRPRYSESSFSMSPGGYSLGGLYPTLPKRRQKSVGKRGKRGKKGRRSQRRNDDYGTDGGLFGW